MFEDVREALQKWTDSGKKVYIYSSGSIAAQKLIFGYSDAGDLLPLLSGHFDTTSGSKVDASSYKAICAAIGVDPARLLFATDNIRGSATLLCLHCSHTELTLS